MTREEECLLKTALAMVVVKKRQQSSSSSREDDGGDDFAAKKKQKQNLMERILQSPSSSSPMLLQLPHPIHIDRIFQAARSMSTVIVNNSNSSSNSNNYYASLHGTTNHLANQLQLWVHQKVKEQQVATTPTTTSSETKKYTGKKEQNVEQWIRSSLMAMPMESTFCVYDSLIGQCQDILVVETIFRVLASLIHDLYYDQLWCNLDEQQQGRNNQQKSNNNKTTVVADVFGVTWLRLAQRCITTSSVDCVPLHQYETMIQILHNVMGELLVPLPSTTNAATTNNILSSSSSPSSLAKTFWELCSTTAPRSTTASSTSTSSSNNKKQRRIMLDPGAKVLLRLGLYRFLYLQPSSN